MRNPKWTWIVHAIDKRGKRTRSVYGTPYRGIVEEAVAREFDGHASVQIHRADDPKVATIDAEWGKEK